MREYKFWKTAICRIAVLVFAGVIGFLPGMNLKAQAMAISEELMEKAFMEEFGDQGDMSALEDLENLDSYDELDSAEMEELAKEYLEQIGGGAVSTEDFSQRLITNPPLKMEMAESGMLRYTLPNGDYYESNVPNGMITASPVALEPSSEVMAVVTKDGESSSLFQSWHFSEPGNYHVKLLFYRFASDQSDDYDLYEVNHYFTIVGRKVNHIGAVPAPDGFEIVSVKKEGVSLEIESPKCLFLSGDGYYEIRYRDTLTGALYVTTSFELDTTAPFLQFSKNITQGEVDGPVEFQTEDIGDRVYLTYNGHSAEAITNVLTSEGDYLVKVVDDVGNRRLYRISIKQRYRIFETKTIILALILLLGSGIYLTIVKRDMKAI